MIKKTIILLVLYFFCRFTSLVCGEKNILANLTNSQEPVGAGRSRVFLAPWSRSRSRLKKNQEPEPLGKKIRSRSRSRLKKKSGAGAGAGKKFVGSPALLDSTGRIGSDPFSSSRDIMLFLDSTGRIGSGDAGLPSSSEIRFYIFISR